MSRTQRGITNLASLLCLSGGGGFLHFLLYLCLDSFSFQFTSKTGSHIRHSTRAVRSLRAIFVIFSRNRFFKFVILLWDCFPLAFLWSQRASFFSP